MIGSLFAGCEETPTPKLHNGNWPDQEFYKRYMGSASYEIKLNKGDTSNQEGISMQVPYTGSVEYAIDQIRDGLRSAFSYAGAYNMKEFKDNAKWGKKT